MPQRAPLESTISNELTSQLPALVFEGRIVVVDKDEQIEDACRDLSSHKVLGFDTETRPSFKAGVSYKVSLLQLSTPSTCYLFRLNKISFAQSIINILESSQIIKLGADVAGDIRSLNQLHPLNDKCFVDLQSDIWEWGVNEKSLRKMAAITLGSRISKAQRLSNWEAAILTPQQQQYAATDAWACIQIYDRLRSIPKLSAEQIKQIKAERALRAAESAAKKEAKKALRKEAWVNKQSNAEGKEPEKKPAKRGRWRDRKQTKTTKE